MGSMETVRKKAIAYRRVSTEEQLDGASMDTQEELIKQYAEAHNIEIVSWFKDPGRSAKDACNRPGVQEMLQYTKENRGKIDFLIVYSVSRISRNMSSYHREIGYKLAVNGVLLRTVTEPIDETPQGKMLLNMYLMVHQYDNDMKAKQTQDNMATHLNDGGWWMSSPPLGYKIEQIPTGAKDRRGKPKTHSRLIPDNTNELATKLTMLLTRFSEGDLTVAQLLKIAHELEIRSRKGKLLPKSTLENILRKPVYAGWHRSKTLTNNELVKMNFDGIISWETFEKNQRILKGDPRPHEENDNALYPLRKTAFYYSYFPIVICHLSPAIHATAVNAGVTAQCSLQKFIKPLKIIFNKLRLKMVQLNFSEKLSNARRSKS